MHNLSPMKLSLLGKQLVFAHLNDFIPSMRFLLSFLSPQDPAAGQTAAQAKLSASGPGGEKSAISLGLYSVTYLYCSVTIARPQ